MVCKMSDQHIETSEDLWLQKKNLTSTCENLFQKWLNITTIFKNKKKNIWKKNISFFSNFKSGCKWSLDFESDGNLSLKVGVVGHLFVVGETFFYFYLSLIHITYSYSTQSVNFTWYICMWAIIWWFIRDFINC